MKVLEKLVNIKSVEGDNNDEIINFLIEKFKPFSKEILKIKNQIAIKTIC